MAEVKNKNDIFNQGLSKLGFDKVDDCFFITDSTYNLSSDPQIQFYLENANQLGATAIYLRKQLNGSYKPQVYLFDFTNRDFVIEDQTELSEIQKKIWSSGEAPLACIFYKTEIKILNCATHINTDYSPVYLIKDLKILGEAHHLYNKQFALKIKSGVFWEEEENKRKFDFSNSAYDVLIKWIRKVTEVLSKKNRTNISLIKKVIIQSILIKYLEERKDESGKGLFKEKYFKQFANSKNFADVLRSKGKFVTLIEKLDKDFNGNLFEWNESEKNRIREISLDILADALEGRSSPEGQLVFDFIKYYEFNCVPVELISRLYEEFLAESKKDEGLFYTPSHLVRLLVDEIMPLRNYDKIDLTNFRILDPACGSGIFLVVAFKRLVQWWRLQNGLNKKREVEDLKKLLKCVYGVDKEQQATQLAAFSLCLALCDELSPFQIISDLRFDDLTKSNILYSDFFINEIRMKNFDESKEIDLEIQVNNLKKLDNLKFDFIVGNSPFVRGGTVEYEKNTWQIGNEVVNIPSGQIALKFLSNSYFYLKPQGLECLIVKSTSLLYGSSSDDYKKFLFSKINVIQILDFTSLARNKSLWDNGADVAAVAIFIKNEEIDFSKNILHLTFRRTKATKERIVFEIDDYDLHFVNRETAINNRFIWKINLLGGGRIKNVIDKLFDSNSFDKYLKDNKCIAQEGYIIGRNGKKKPNYIFKIPTIPTEAINEKGIDYSQLNQINKNLKFVKVPPEIIFSAPNIIVWENIGGKKFPIFFNEISFSFKHKIIGIASLTKDKKLLQSIVYSFEKYSSLYKFLLYTTSSQVLVNRNTAILKQDIMQLPFIEQKRKSELTKIDYNIVNETNQFYQEFLRKGEGSKAVKSIENDKYEMFMENYGKEFSSVLNLIYANKNKKFRLSEVVKFEDAFIATVFKYDEKDINTKFGRTNINFEYLGLSNHEISRQFSINRIIKLYPQKDVIVFIKPNQYRYWLSLAAYRDADKCFSDLSQLGY